MISFKALPFLPFIGLAFSYFLSKYPKLENIRNKISPIFAILFLLCSLTLKGKKEYSLNLLDIFGNFEIALSFGTHQTFFCILLGIFWLLTSLYSARYFLITSDKKIAKFDILFLTTIGLLSCIILSKNLISAAIFYQLLAFVIYLNANLFASKNSAKSIKHFGSFLIISASLMFLNALLTFIMSGQNQFLAKGVFELGNLDIWQFSYLLFFYFAAIISFAFLPFYFLFRDIYYLNPPAIIATLLSFALAILVLLHKIIFFIFDMKLFAHFMEQVNSSDVLTIIIALNLIALIVFALRSENLKQILVLLFFNQLILIIMSEIIIGLNFKKTQIMIASFILSQMLIFFAVGNISLYLKESGHKSLSGTFYTLRITIVSLIFALVNLSGLLPAAGMVDKYWLLRDIMINHSWLKGSILLGNIALLLICTIKIVFPMFEIRKEKVATHNEQHHIEQDLSLISPTIIIPIILFTLLLPFVQRFIIG